MVAETHEKAALAFWEDHKRNHQLPQLIDVVSVDGGIQYTFQIKKEVTVQRFYT